MKVRGQEYVELGSYVLLQNPWVEGKIIGKLDGYTVAGQPRVKIIYAEDNKGLPQTKTFGHWLFPPTYEMELFTGDIDEVEAKLAAHML